MSTRGHASYLLFSLFAFGLYALFYLLLFARSLASGNYIAPSDSFDFGLSAFLSVQEVWTEYLYSGYPIAADPQSLMWYPVFRAFVSVGHGWNAFLILPFVVASFTCCLFVRHLGARPAAALFSGLVYGSSSTLMVHISHFNQLHVAAWVPLLPYGLSLICSGRRIGGIALGSVGLALMVLAGHPQLMVYCVYLSAGYLAYRVFVDGCPVRQRVTNGLIGGLTFVLGFGLAAVQLVPANELVSLSNRAGGGWGLFTSGAFQPKELITLLFPHAFGEFGTGVTRVGLVGTDILGPSGHSPDTTGYLGLLPLCLVVFGVWHAKQYRRELLFWGVSSAVAVLLTLGASTPLARLVFYLPLYGSFQAPDRHFLVYAFSVAVAAGLVLSHVTSCQKYWRLARRCMSYGLVSGVFVCGAFLYSSPEIRQYLVQDMHYLTWAYLLPASVAISSIVLVTVCIRWTRSVMIFTVLLIGVHAADIFAHHFLHKAGNLQYAEISEGETRVPSSMETVREALRVNQGRIVALDGPNNPFIYLNMSRAWQIPTVGGKDPLLLSRYSEMLDLSGSGDIGQDILSRRHVGLDVLDVRYALIPETWLATGNIEIDPDRWVVENTMYPHSADPDDDIPYVLVRNGRALSPAWLVPSVTTLGPEDTRVAVVSSRLPDGTVFDPSKRALIESSADIQVNDFDLSESVSCGSATVALKTSRIREYVVNNHSRCFLVMSEVFYPWWRASINGRRTTLIRTNHALMGISVPKGESRVRLTLVPESLYYGAGLTTVSLLIWLLLLLNLRFDGNKWCLGVGVRRSSSK